MIRRLLFFYCLYIVPLIVIGVVWFAILLKLGWVIGLIFISLSAPLILAWLIKGVGLYKLGAFRYD